MLPKRLFARKSLEALRADAEGDTRLRRALGPVGLTALGIGAIIGAGIFVMTGRVAAQDAGPAVVLSFCIAGTGCLFAALCYAEFASLAPVAGSAYTYAYATLGELLAWIIGWDLILEYAMACACVASSWSKYLNQFLLDCFGMQVPAYLCSDPFTNPDAWFNLPAMLIMAGVTFVVAVGIRESASANAVLVIVKLSVVVFVIVLGVQFVNPTNWTGIPVEARHVPEDPASKWGILGLLGLNEWLLPLDEAVRSNFAPYGLSGIMLGAAIVFFAFIGFDSISTAAEEARNPQRDMPIGILSSLLICTLLYVGVSAVLTGMLPYPEIDPNAAVASAFSQKAAIEDSTLLRASAALIAAGALAGMTSVMLITFYSQSRIFFAMSRDGLLPVSVFGTVHPRFRTPFTSSVVTGAVISVVAALTPITKLEEMVNIGTLFAFVVVCASVLLLRSQRPDARRPFRAPLIYLVAPAGIFVNLLLMLFLPWDTWGRLVGWLVVGLAIYLTYGIRHSRVGGAVQ